MKGLTILIMFAAVFFSCSGPGGLKFRDPQKGVVTEAKPTPEPVPTATPTPGMDPWFNRLYTNIFQPKCLACHKGANPSGGVNLTTYEAIMALDGLVIPNEPDISGLYMAVQGNQMPPRPLDSLTADEKESIFKWISAGAPFEVPLP